MDIADSHQRRLLQQCQSTYEATTPISETTANAFLATPRHLFVSRYRHWGTPEWQDVRPDNLQEHLAAIYVDHPLILFGDDDDEVPSTISQPSFVLRMLDMLQLQPGQQVFELGAGSGWNAALMARLVGPDGHVHTVEIIPEMAGAAAAALDRAGIRNVTVITGDGGDGYPPAAPYDRAAFTAGAYDLPRAFHEQVKPGGLLLTLVKNAGGGDNLFLLRKADDHFVSLDATPCGFVQLQGAHRVEDLEPITLDRLEGWEELRTRHVSRIPFWWGGKGSLDFVWRTLGIRSFLSIAEPSFRAFKTAGTQASQRDQHYFGLWLSGEPSLVLARDDELISFGTTAARDRLLSRIRQWVELGMPTAASFDLRIYPADVRVDCEPGEWLVKRRESQYLWSLSAGVSDAVPMR